MSGTNPSPSLTRRLPRQPSLEQLRKQAKDLQRQYRAGDSAAIAEVERFERAPDPAAFALHDAQRVLARAYGFGSWSRLKAFVDGVSVARLAEAVEAGDLAEVRRLLAARPELIGMDMAASDEHRAIHYAVLGRDAAMVRLLMAAGADARKGIFPHRDATSAMAIARDREYQEIVAIIEEAEQLRRREGSCPNVTVSPEQEKVAAAISAGDAATAVRLLDADPRLIHACGRGGAIPLHVAAEQTDADLVAWMLERGANAGKQDLRGLTPLDRAALSADPRNSHAQRFPAVASLLVARGARLTIRGAVALGDAGQVREILRADPGLLRQTGPAGGLVTLAVNHGRREMVRLLLDLGADVDERTMLPELEEPTISWGMPLWYAALAGRFDICELLLDRGADPNANVYASGWPLRNAWNHKDDSVKRLLLARGAKPQPYMVSEAHDVDEARRLLEADPSEELARELAWSAGDHGCPAILELALGHLHWPAQDPRWHWVLIQPIRGAGSDPAANEGRFRSMATLLRHGVDANVSRFGQTALHFAAARHSGLGGADRARFAAMLLEYGARLDTRDDLLRSTPLGWACRWGRLELTELLMARGAPVDEADAEPWATPKAWARKMGHERVLALLRRHGAA
ncbi:MAG: ankyrin repeat domain-containing protein [Bryobacteraceae bacterium]|jgi:ankyrin repeat protein